MKRQRVSSAAVASVGYDVDGRMLEVEFRSGAVYRYAEVPPPVFLRLVNAQSIGEYVNRRIKPSYECVWVGESS